MNRSITKACRCISYFQKSAKFQTNSLMMRNVTFGTKLIQSRYLSSSTIINSKFKAEKNFVTVLDKEIELEKEQYQKPRLPQGYSVKEQKGSSITLERTFDDGVVVQIKCDLAGSVDNVMDTDVQEMGTEEAAPQLRSRPEFVIRLVKPSGKAVVFNCTMPDEDIPPPVSGEDDTIPTFAVDSVEVETVPGYYVYTDLFDETIFSQMMSLLLERELNSTFQVELQQYFNTEEHRLYLEFLNGLNVYCKE